jgi:hemolysin activation/secretion protein
MHEAFTVNYAGSTQVAELQYVAGSYRQVLTAEGLTFFANAGMSRGRPGRPVDPILDYTTRSLFMDSGLSYPVVRQRERNLTLSGLWFMSHDESDIAHAPLTLDRLRGFRARADADFADPLNGINQINVVYSHGIDGWGSSSNGNLLASRARGRVDFQKMEWTLSRTQPLPASFSALVALYAQYAWTPLLASELCTYGGRYFGRAYEPSDLLGDSCVELLAELRYDLGLGLKDLVQSQLYAFADRGWLHNIAPVSGTGANVDGASVGGGIRLGWLTPLTGPTAYNADLSVAKAVAGPRDAWRFFFILAARY